MVNVGRGTTIVAGLCLAQGLSWTLAAQEDDPEFFLPDIEVIGISPIQGTGVDIDAVPSNVRTLEADQFDRVQPLNLPDLLDKALGSVSAVDVQNNPYQKNVNYRGFTSSPLLGEPQGLAIYQNGVRINEPFGDVMQWDLVPEVAIDRVELHAANPVFGLNALGGALTLGLKNGFTYQGVGAEATGGYFGRGGAQFELGGGNETTTLYMAAERHHDDGWRNRSKSDISRLYLNLTHETESAVFSLDFGRGDNSLNGNGPAPVELLESNRRAVFTWPDITDNDLLFGTFSGSYDVADSISFQANAYFRRVIRKTFNGDEVEAANCDAAQINGGAPLGDAALAAFSATGGAANAAGGAGFICQEEDTPEFVISQDGDLIPSFGTFYGAGNVSSTMTKGYGFGVQAMIDESLLDTDNQLVVGGSLDYGLTRFHTEQFLAKLTLDRTLDFSSLQPILNVASFEAAVGGGGDGLAANNQTIPTNLKARNRYYGVFVSDTLNVDENLALTL
ncbi:MAG: Plug domain-containing protein, partial [Alphaproteobacteria bacterium]|nr:Plug domain-containing protein [Alphaproteobacteria bacterium]